jgi:hypothetical protein
MQTVEEEGVFWLMNADSVQEKAHFQIQKKKLAILFYGNL